MNWFMAVLARCLTWGTREITMSLRLYNAWANVYAFCVLILILPVFGMFFACMGICRLLRR